MKNIAALHNQAMDLAEEAMIQKVRGDNDGFERLSREAFYLEKEAASLLSFELDKEPTRSVLHRSAATLALDCGMIREAEKLISTALFGNPPDEIAEELRDLLEEVNFERHLDLRGVSLEPDEFQVSLTGQAIGFGVALSDAFVDRVKVLQKLIHRTSERLSGREFRERGLADKEVRENFEIYLTAPRPGSFAISFRIGKKQGDFGFNDLGSAEVVSELVDCLKLASEDDKEALRNKIKEDVYYTNFLALSKKLAPDGKNITSVGITSKSEGAFKKVRLSGFPKNNKSKKESEEICEHVFVGVLKFADSTGKKDKIKIESIEDSSKHETIVVPEGMMNDIVRPLWEEVVEVPVYKKGKEYILKDINKVE